jgi:hypothetical protein
MAFIIQTPPAIETPKTQIENVEYELSPGIPGVESNLRIYNLDENIFETVYFNNKFLSLKDAWESNTMFLSSVSKIVEDNNFKRIVEMGEKVIPLIIDEIEKKPSTLVWALNYITNSTIEFNQRMTVTEACKRWVKVFRKSQINSEIQGDNAKFRGE